MKRLFKSVVPILLVISLVFTMGIESIGIDNPNIETNTENEEAPKDPPKEEPKQETEEGKEDTGEPKQEEPKAEEPKGEEPKQEEPTKEEEPEKPEEPKQEEPDEEIEEPEEGLIAIMPMGIPTIGNYTSDSDTTIVQTELYGVSINTHTIPSYIWSKDGTVHAAVKSTHQLQHMTLSGSTSTDFDEYDPLVNIKIDGVVYEPKDGLGGNTKDAHWTVFKFDLSKLAIPSDGLLKFFIKGIGGGHDVGGDMKVIVPKIDITGNKEWVGGESWPSIKLQLKRYVEGSDPSTAVVADTGTVDGTIDEKEIVAWSYKWSDMPEYSPYGQRYIYFVDEETVPQYYEKTFHENKRTVINTYKPPQGEITITKIVENPKGLSLDSNQEFDIFVKGPEGDYVVTLKNGESKTIENLPIGVYTISEIVPMNYKLLSISNPSITLTVDNLKHSTKVTNEYDNDSWFYDEDTRINTFSGVVVNDNTPPKEPTKILSRILEEMILPEEEIEMNTEDLENDN